MHTSYFVACFSANNCDIISPVYEKAFNSTQKFSLSQTTFYSAAVLYRFRLNNGLRSDCYFHSECYSGSEYDFRSEFEFHFECYFRSGYSFHPENDIISAQSPSHLWNLRLMHIMNLECDFQEIGYLALILQMGKVIEIITYFRLEH